MESKFIKDVLVITPPRKSVLNNVIINNYPPNNQGIDSVPLRLAAVIEKKFNVGFFPFYYTQYNYYNLDLEEVENVIQKYSPKILVVSTDYFISNRTTSTVNSSLEVIKEYKRIFPNGKAVVVGKHAIVGSADFFKDEKGADVVITCEAEDAINDVIELLLANEKEKLIEIPNLAFRNKNGDIIFSENKELIIDLNELPVPAFHLLNDYIEDFIEKEKPLNDKLSITLRTSYGCIYQCPFCAGVKNWNNYRTRCAKKIEEDVCYFNECLGDRAEICFLDDELFTMDKEHVRAVANIFKKYNIVVQGVLTHINFFDEEIAQMLSQFSASVIFGGENFCNEVLKKLGKQQTREKIIEGCQIAKKYGLGTRVEYICGLPYENSKTVIENINFIFNAIAGGKIDIVVPYILVPHPGTKFNVEAESYGIRILDGDYSNYIEEGNFPVYETEYLSRSQIYIYYLLLINNIYAAKRINQMLGNTNFLNDAGYSLELFDNFFNKI